MEQIARALSEYTLEKLYKFLGIFCGNVSLDGSCKSAAVNSPSGGLIELREEALAKVESKRDSLLCHVYRGIYVLQIAERGSARRKNAREIFCNIARLESRLLLCNAIVFRKEVESAKDRTVANLFTKSGNILHKLFSASFAENGSSELCGNRLHLGGNSGIVGGKICVVSACVDDAEAISCLGKVKINLLNNRRRGICKVDRNDTACSASHLVHKSARLAEELVFGILRDLCKSYEINASFVVEMLQRKRVLSL